MLTSLLAIVQPCCRCLADCFLKVTLPLGKSLPGVAAAQTEPPGILSTEKLKASGVCDTARTLHTLTPSLSVDAHSWPPMTELEKTEQVVNQANDPDYW